MIFTCIKIDGNRYIPAYPSDHEKSQKLKNGEEYEFTVKQPRNPQFHRKFFAMLKACFDTQEDFNDMEEMRAYLTMKAGFYKRVATPQGEMILPKSISFAKMDDLEFEELYSKVLDAIIKFLKCDADSFENILIDFM